MSAIHEQISWSWLWKNQVEFGELAGKILTEIRVSNDEDEIVFICSDGTRYLMYHDQDCCESVIIEDICGDINCLLNTPITMAEDISNECNEGPMSEWDESYTWTWYKLATVKGYVTIRWYGESNGYYSESVQFARLPDEKER